jgi:hypothetical protein
MIRFVKDYEVTRHRSHPVGMTFQWAKGSSDPVTDTMLLEGPADWISPRRDGKDGETHCTDPPVADGRKIVLLDTDHLWGIGGNVGWVWTSFLRGYNPIFTDAYDNKVLGKVRPEQWNPLRQALGQTRRLADRLDLAAMTPQPGLASTSYCLARAGHEYVVFLPEGGRARVDLSGAGKLNVEWVHPIEGTRTPAGSVAGGQPREFEAPFAGVAVLHLSKQQ